MASLLARGGSLIAVVALIACSPASQPQKGSGTDAGSPVDAGTNTDSGTSPTDGGPIDAGQMLLPDGGIPIICSSITPPNGPASGGTVVVIVGSGFANDFAPNAGPTATIVTTVSFGSNQVDPTTLSVVDDNTIQLTVPPGDPGPSVVTITNPNGVGTCTGDFTYYGTVSMDSISPTEGTTLGGTSFTITGQGFDSSQIVLFGDEQAPQSQLTFSADGTTITGVTPPGPAGSANVGVVSANTSAFLDRGFVYVQPITVTSVTPNSSALAGGGTATVTGQGFTVDTQVSLGGVAATTTFVSATSLTISIPAATAAGAVDVIAASARATGTLPNGFAYFDDSMQLQLFAVSPSQGPIAGGTCAAGTGCLHIVGSGFPTDGSLQIAVGVNQSTGVNVTSANTVDVDLPPASAAGIVGIFARSSAGNASLPNAFAYVAPLTIASVTPNSGPAAGSTTATINTTGFASTCQVFIGAAQATVTGSASDGSSVTVTIPPGSTGPADVRITCGTPGAIDFQQAVLAGGYSYTAALQILQVSPNSGAIAGNTAVTIYGNGFATGLQVLFGDGPATQVTVVSPFEATVRTPPGNVGFVDVTTKVATASAVLPGGFGYFDPKNSTGGGSGGPMDGILNVTVLNETQGFYGQPVPGVTISINADVLLGTTDENGQVTFSDSTLLKPVSITGSAAGFETVTVASIDARDVTIYMPMTSGGSPSSSNPPPVQPATFQGTVCGFKLPPSVATDPTQHPQAQVFFTYPYVYAAPPFGFAQTPVVVSQDCGTWTMQTDAFGAIAIYAIFGTVDDNDNFTPYLMAVMEGLQAVPNMTVQVPIVLNMHLDLSFPVTILVDGTVTNQTYSYLDLGGEGVVPLANITATQNTFTFANHPEVSGEGIVFLNLSFVPDPSGQPPNSVSFYYYRQQGDLTAGVTIGPMLPFTTLSTPTQGGLFSGSLGWSLGMGPQPDMQQVDVYGPDGTPMWDVVLPGSDVGVSVPPSALASVTSDGPVGAMFTWTLLTASSPRFEYDYFSYDQLGLNAWTAFTQNQGQFMVP